MQFSPEQQYAIDEFLLGKNVFMSGFAGTGKTQVIKNLWKKTNKKIQVCSLTGCSALLLNCQAKTIHSWSGIGICKGELEDIIKLAKKKKYCKTNWQTTDVLIVDEISMMSKQMFDVLNAMGKIFRKDPRPFGGIQLVFSGDFYQLPPIGEKGTESSQYCFESNDWFHVFPKKQHILFKTIFRQTDENYKKILNELREGFLSSKSYKLLQSCLEKNKNKNNTKDKDNIIPTKLFPKRGKVDELNASCLNELPEPIYEFKVKSLYNLNEKNKSQTTNWTKDQIEAEITFMKNNIRCEDNLKLKIGAQVMCIFNINLLFYAITSVAVLICSNNSIL